MMTGFWNLSDDSNDFEKLAPLGTSCAPITFCEAGQKIRPWFEIPADKDLEESMTEVKKHTWKKEFARTTVRIDRQSQK